jgi:protein-S-isoprenylcysteine O-methyltransferase Ste14
MEYLLRIAIPTYFVIYFLFAFVIRSIITAKQIGKNPLVFPKDDSAYALLGFYFKIFILSLFIFILAFGCSHSIYDYMSKLQNNYFIAAGTTVWTFSLIWTLIAQKQMKKSWRIGIDAAEKTELVTTGLFAYSRNPIFFGMLLALLGLLLIVPDAFTLMFFVVGFILMDVQIRLEEEYLQRMHGSSYLSYKEKTRRWI